MVTARALLLLLRRPAHPATRCRHLRLPSRSYFTIPSVRFSPSHTTSRDFVWEKEVGDAVACYDLLYTTTAAS